MVQPFTDDPHARGSFTVHRVDSTTSTQDDLRALTDPAHLTTVCAGHQTQGRGRLGRSWESSPGQSLLASTFVALPDTDRMRERIGFLTLIAAASVRAALADLTGSEAFKVKFPNDIVIGNHKIGGVLGEFLPDHSAARGELNAAIGIGVNVSQQQPDLIDGATSLHAESFDIDQHAGPGHNPTQTGAALAHAPEPYGVVDRLLERYLTHLGQRIDAFARAASASELITELNNNLYGRGAQATAAGKTGTIAGLTDDAHLILHGDQEMYVSPADVAMFVEYGLTKQPSVN